MKPSLSVGDLNDFLEPAQICIKMPTDDKNVEEEKAEVEINPMPAVSTQQPVTINLTDCLACSGCVTSAETVLIAQQSWDFVKEAMEKQRKLVFSISPQSRVAIAEALGVDMSAGDRLITSYLHSLPNTVHIMDTNHARNYSLNAVGKEFVQKFKCSEELPLLTSACPGWICFVEKTHPELIPFVSKARSPQQLMGVLVRETVSDAFHISVMPCYDKKLEASRSDFKTNDVSDVDCVLTTTELLDLIKDCDLSTLDQEAADFGPSHEGSGAGGYLEYTLRFAAAVLFPDEADYVVKETLHRGNVDFVEYELLASSNGSVLLRFARIWGMRNIQTWLRMHKSRPNRYHFVEVMACPGGCLNGGGQPSLMKADKSRLGKLKDMYAQMPKMESPVVNTALYEDLDRRGLLWTRYREVKMANTSFAIKW